MSYQVDTVYIPKFTHPDIAGVTFGGFQAGKYIASQPNATPDDDNPDVSDSSSVGSVPALSRPGVPAWRYISYWEARKACANLNGLLNERGWHLMTAFEWASLAMWSHKHGTQPHGNNANANPPVDVTFTSEAALLDRACYARNSGWYASLTGTGPATWNHNGLPSGVADLNGNMWEWNMGFHMQTADEAGHDGHALVLASTEVGLTLAPYGLSTSVGTNTLTDSDKAWTTDYFTAGGGAGATCYLMDSAGTRFTISSNTADTITVSSGNPTSGPYEIVIDSGTDITSGMSSGNKILTIETSDATLKAFGIPASSDGTGVAEYGTDVYLFNAADAGAAPNNIRTALRGGAWGTGVRAGVFALTLDSSPTGAVNYISFRAAKSL